MQQAAANSPPNIWFGQILHFGALAALLPLVLYLWKFMGRPLPSVFWIAFLMPVLHQIFVWIAWRLELQSSTISKTIGFRAYLVIFFVLFGARFISLGLLAWLDRASLNMSEAPRVLITIVLTVLSVYAIYSVHRYFGLARAAGADHFEDRYRKIPFVKQGIFRFTSNGMYIYAFLVFWAIGVGFNSSAALIIAGFSHAYIWVHYFATEKPDMDYIYNSKSPNRE